MSARPVRVLVCSGSYLYSILHPRKETALLRELQARGYEVRRVVLDTHAPHYPPAVVRAMREAPTRHLRQIELIHWHLAWADVVLVSNHRSSPQIIEWARALGKVTVQHDDHGGLDGLYYGADWAAVKGPWFHDHMVEHFPAMTGRVFSTGSVEYDDLHTPETLAWTRERFCQEYGLDPGKRIAAWLPSALYRHDDWGIAKYKEICRIIREDPNHSLIIKAHASDYGRYAKRGSDPFDGRASWEALAPNAAICRPEHTTICLLHADVGVSIHSSVGLEYPLFGRPLLYVDAFGTERLAVLARKVHRIPHPRQAWREWLVPWTPSLVGLSISAQELPGVLAEYAYDVGTPEKYAEHIAYYLTANDGQAYQRIADVVDRAAATVAEKRIGRLAQAARLAPLLAGSARAYLRDALRRPAPDDT